MKMDFRNFGGRVQCSFVRSPIAVQCRRRWQLNATRSSQLGVLEFRGAIAELKTHLSSFVSTRTIPSRKGTTVLLRPIRWNRVNPRLIKWERKEIRERGRSWNC